MRISLLASGDATHDPRVRALARSLRDVGHAVTIVCGGSGPSSDDGVAVVRVPSRVPVGLGRFGWILRRMQWKRWRTQSYRARLVAAVRSTNPDLIYATSRTVVGLAARAVDGDAVVVRRPEWGGAGTRDIVTLAPHQMEFSTSPAGPGMPFHTPHHTAAVSYPVDGRYAGRRVHVAYRRTETTPGRYIEAALVRAGFRVDHSNDRLDWDVVDPTCDFVLFVESPHPAIVVSGANPGIPVLFWAHHGDHSTDTHLRLARRYGAHGILLAHSWHVAHRFPVPVHRFPFGVPDTALDPTIAWEERPFDVGFVGAQIRRSGGTYERRQQLVADIERHIPTERRCIESGVDAERMAEIYAHARTVFNEGGLRHYPITMRVFEAIGSRALLLTDDLPGTDLLFVPGDHYEILSDDVVAQIDRLVADPTSEDRATAAYDYALGHHLYQHRVDELAAIAASIDPSHVGVVDDRELSALGRMVDADAQTHRIATFGAGDLAPELPWRAVWSDPDLDDSATPRSFDAVVIGSDWQGDVTAAVRRAGLFVYGEGPDVSAVGAAVTALHPDAIGTANSHGDLRFDLLTDGYRVFPDGHRIAK